MSHLDTWMTYPPAIHSPAFSAPELSLGDANPTLSNMTSAQPEAHASMILSGVIG